MKRPRLPKRSRPTKPQRPQHPSHPHPHPHPTDHVTHAELAKAIRDTRSLEQSDVQGLANRVAKLEADVAALITALEAIDSRVSALEMLVS